LAVSSQSNHDQDSRSKNLNYADEEDQDNFLGELSAADMEGSLMDEGAEGSAEK